MFFFLLILRFDQADVFPQTLDLVQKVNEK